MLTELDSRTAEVADSIVNQFIRLGFVMAASVARDPHGCLAARPPVSWLMATPCNVVTDLALVTVYDESDADDTNGIFDGDRLLAHLKKLDESISFEDMWEGIAEFEQ